jgi:hypothetical protein
MALSQFSGGQNWFGGIGQQSGSSSTLGNLGAGVGGGPGIGKGRSPPSHWTLLNHFRTLSDDEIESFLPQICNLLFDRETVIPLLTNGYNGQGQFQSSVYPYGPAASSNSLSPYNRREIERFEYGRDSRGSIGQSRPWNDHYNTAVMSDQSEVSHLFQYFEDILIEKAMESLSFGMKLCAMLKVSL